MGRRASRCCSRAGRLVYYVFDCLELDGVPLVDRPIEERRERLAEIAADPSHGVRLSESFEDGEALLAAARSRGLEGIVAKRAGSRYTPGRRSPDWLKLKAREEQEFVVVGYTAGSGNRAESFGALALAVRDGGELRYVGNVGSGFSTPELARLRRLLDPLKRPDAPLPEAPKLARARGRVTWVEPRLVVEVRFSEWTHDGHLRQPTYVGLRDDKAPREVRREHAAEETLRVGRRELRLVNLDKVFWPEQGLTKGDLLDYYRAVAPVLVPHLRGRPFTMRRYPDGIAGKAFFQKDAPVHMPAWIKTFAADVHTRSRERSTKRVEFPLVDDELALLWMVNMGCIDMNAWYSRIDKPDRPDFVLFDLDPTPEVPYAQTVEVALILKGLLDGLGLQSFPKTSGGKGFHVLVPLDRRSTYEDTRGFAEHVAGVIVAAYPTLATTAWSKIKRKGVLIDANQNGLGKTIASVYSVRPHPGAPVSTPLTWDEVTPRLDPAAFTLGVVLDRVERHGDLYEGVLKTRQSLGAALRALTSG
jgi:bifunctional non-homologous end joining protein LigD